MLTVAPDRNLLGLCDRRLRQLDNAEYRTREDVVDVKLVPGIDERKEQCQETEQIARSVSPVSQVLDLLIREGKALAPSKAGPFCTR